jgi:hypothetical protein
MKKLLGVILAFSICLLVAIPASAETVTAQRIILPAYYDEPETWQRTYSTLSAGDIAIINPADGNGSSKSSAYATIVNTLKAKGVVPAGYVWTKYGTRAASTVKAQIDAYYSWYGVTSIFLDEADNTAAMIPYYLDLYNYIHAKGGTVIINPGTTTIEQYMTVCDIAMTVETPYSGYAGMGTPSWVYNYAVSRFATLVYECSEANMPTGVSLSKQRNAGYIYVTNDTSSNPWDTLAPYMVSEKSLASGTVQPTAAVTATQAVTPTVAPTPTAAPAMLGDINGDGISDISDILYLRAIIIGTYELEPSRFHVADINNDGIIDINDILYIRAFIIGV